MTNLFANIFDTFEKHRNYALDDLTSLDNEMFTLYPLESVSPTFINEVMTLSFARVSENKYQCTQVRHAFYPVINATVFITFGEHRDQVGSIAKLTDPLTVILQSNAKVAIGHQHCLVLDAGIDRIGMCQLTANLINDQGGIPVHLNALLEEISKILQSYQSVHLVTDNEWLQLRFQYLNPVTNERCMMRVNYDLSEDAIVANQPKISRAAKIEFGALLSITTSASR